ncbi:MAG: cyclic nucleotide-binding domain-containing protein [Cyanobacteriota bacterium]
MGFRTWWSKKNKRPFQAAASAREAAPAGNAHPPTESEAVTTTTKQPTKADAGDLATLLRANAEGVGEAMQLHQGDLLVREGDESDKIYIVMAGEIAVSIRNQSGDEVTVATIGADKVIGEMTLFGESKRSATCRAASETVDLIAISNEKALQIIDQHPQARHGLVMELTRRSRSMLQYINEFSHLTELISAGDYGSVQAQINLSSGSGDGTLKAARSAFAAMLSKIKEREAELQSKIQSLTIQIDQARAAKEIQSITDDSMFQSLQQNSASLRARMRE